MSVELPVGPRWALLSALALLASACGTPGPCPLGTVECGGVCAVLERDQDHCGACGNACPGGDVCNGAGECAFVCLPGLAVCEGLCTDPLSSRAFCGAGPDCTGGAACGPGEVCAGGTCAETCQPGFVSCNGVCTDPLVSRAFCGAAGSCTGPDAGVSCEPGEVCTSGVCALECQPGQVICGGQCTDPQISNRFCGASGTCEGLEAGEVCAPGTICSAGECQTSCQPGQIECGGRCTDPLIDNVYCGAEGDCADDDAGMSCETGTICSAGRCGPTCQPGWIECGGRCAEPLTDNVYCGAVGDCTGDDAGESCAPGTICSQGACGVTCLAGSIECGGRCIDTSFDRAYCGATGDCEGENIGVECTSGRVCSSGRCRATCQWPEIRCDGRCVDPGADVRYCGATGDCEDENTGVQCPSGHVCAGGECVVTCQEELVQCGEVCVDPMSDAEFCGASGDCTGDRAGIPCRAGEVCQDGVCTLGPCPDGLLDCGIACVDPDSNPFFCGASSDCEGANAGETCGRREACDDGVCTGLAVPGTDIRLFEEEFGNCFGSVTLTGSTSLDMIIGRSGGEDSRAYVTFDLSGLSATQVVAAYLRLRVAQYESADAEETLSVWDSASFPGGPAGFADLGSGSLYGVGQVQRTDLATVIEIDLHGAALADILDAAGDTFTVGLRLTTLRDGAADEFAATTSRLGSGGVESVHQLAVEYVPTP